MNILSIIYLKKREIYEIYSLFCLPEQSWTFAVCLFLAPPTPDWVYNKAAYLQWCRSSSPTPWEELLGKAIARVRTGIPVKMALCVVKGGQLRIRKYRRLYKICRIVEY